jgi:hypothetical protein
MSGFKPFGSAPPGALLEPAAPEHSSEVQNFELATVFGSADVPGHVEHFELATVFGAANVPGHVGNFELATVFYEPPEPPAPTTYPRISIINT